MYVYNEPLTFIVGMLAIAVIMLIYFLPTIIASCRKNINFAGIFILNLFLGIMLIGWVIALIWAIIGRTDEEHQATAKLSPADEIEKLNKLKVDGVITEDEFNKLKDKILKY